MANIFGFTIFWTIVGMKSQLKYFKKSLPAISQPDTEVLILGTLPGDRSLEKNEYFAHTGNRFWKIIAAITKNPVPESYSEKLELLKKNKIGLWNVLHKATRKGSLDMAIKNEVLNDIPGFVKNHQKLKVIGFDGEKAAALYDKNFSREKDITYITLPGCSAANARFDLEKLCNIWRKILV